MQERVAFLHDMSIVGDVLLKVCSCQRINYDILGNTKQFLHAHIFQRYQLEKSGKYPNQLGFMILLIGLTRNINMK